MKTTIFLISLFLTCIFCNATLAQNNKKTTNKKPAKAIYKKPNKLWEAGGNFSIDLDNGGTSTGVDATIAYYISEKTQLGLRLGTAFQTGLSTFSGGVFGKHFIKHFYVGAGLDYTRISFNNSTIFGSFNLPPINLVSANLGGGFRYPLGDNFKLDTGLNLNIPISPAGSNIYFTIHAGAVYAF